MQANFSALQYFAGTSVDVLPVIKSNAYGHGMEKIALALPDAKLFAVSDVAELKHLRDAKIHTPVLIMYGAASLEETVYCAENNADLVVHSHYQIPWLLKLSGNSKLDVSIKIDSGMGRLGFSVPEAADVYPAVINHVLP